MLAARASECCLCCALLGMVPWAGRAVPVTALRLRKGAVLALRIGRLRGRIPQETAERTEGWERGGKLLVSRSSAGVLGRTNFFPEPMAHSKGGSLRLSAHWDSRSLPEVATLLASWLE